MKPPHEWICVSVILRFSIPDKAYLLCGAEHEDWEVISQLKNKKLFPNLNCGNNSPGLNRASEHVPTNLTFRAAEKTSGVRAPISSDILNAPCNSADHFVFKHTKFFYKI